MDAMNLLSSLYINQDRPEAAEPFIVETVALRRKLFGDRHPRTLDALGNLASVHM